jgi:DNA-binding transcriptional LysR family regulator
VVGAQQDDIHRAILEGGPDLGLLGIRDAPLRPSAARRSRTELRLHDRRCGDGKLMVAEGLGLTLLPDFSVRGDPLERGGAITFRPLADPGGRGAAGGPTRRAAPVPRALRDLHPIFIERAAELSEGLSGSAQS